MLFNDPVSSTEYLFNAEWLNDVRIRKEVFMT